MTIQPPKNPVFIEYNWDGIATYLMPDGTTKDAYQLIQMGYIAPLGDNPTHSNDRECQCGSGETWVNCSQNSQECG
jgi:hypothetical protein